MTQAVAVSWVGGVIGWGGRGCGGAGVRACISGSWPTAGRTRPVRRRRGTSRAQQHHATPNRAAVCPPKDIRPTSRHQGTTCQPKRSPPACSTGGVRGTSSATPEPTSPSARSTPTPPSKTNRPAQRPTPPRLQRNWREVFQKLWMGGREKRATYPPESLEPRCRLQGVVPRSGEVT